MTLKDKFVTENNLTGRRRLGPLGWITIFIAVLFLFACGLGAYQLVTHNVSQLVSDARGATQPTALTAIPTAESVTPLPATLTATRPVTWTVWKAQDPLTGRTIYDGPAEIKQWAIRDYQISQKWMLDHLFEKDLLIAHLAEYFSGDALEMERGSIRESFEKTHLIWAPLIAQPRQPAPLDQPMSEGFSSDGRLLDVTDYTDSGNWKQYNTQTRALVAIKAHKFFWVYTLEYDPASSRWKVARLRQIYDIDANRASYTNEP